MFNFQNRRELFPPLPSYTQNLNKNPQTNIVFVYRLAVSFILPHMLPDHRHDCDELIRSHLHRSVQEAGQIRPKLVRYNAGNEHTTANCYHKQGEFTFFTITSTCTYADR